MPSQNCCIWFGPANETPVTNAPINIQITQTINRVLPKKIGQQQPPLPSLWHGLQRQKAPERPTKKAVHENANKIAKLAVLNVLKVLLISPRSAVSMESLYCQIILSTSIAIPQAITRNESQKTQVAGVLRYLKQHIFNLIIKIYFFNNSKLVS